MPIRSALPIVAAGYAERFNVQIEIGGDEAYTDGNTIRIPSIEKYPNNDIIWGYLAHEAAHVKWTDFTVRASNQQEHVLVNALEDVRVERCMMNEYPGTGYTLTALDEHLVNQEQHEVGGSPYSLIIQAALYWGMLNITKKTCFTSLDSQVREEVKQVFGEEFYNDFYSLIEQEFPIAQNTSEILTLVRKIRDLAQQYADDADADSDSAASAGADDDADADSDNAASAGADDDADADSDNAASAGADDDADADSDNAASAGADDDADANSDNAASASADDDADADSDGAVNPFKEVLNPQNVDLKDRLDSIRQSLSGQAKPNSTSLKIGTSKREMLELYHGEIEQDTLSNKLQLSLRRVIEAETRKKTRKKRTGRRLKAQDLTKPMSGNTRIFRHRANTKGIDTALHLLVDASSSMRLGCRYNVANSAAFALSKALYATAGVNPACSYFGPWEENVHVAMQHGTAPKKNNFLVMPERTTPLAEGLYLATHQIIKTKNNRKVVLVLTDGVPDCFESAEKALDLMGKNSIEVYAIGIMPNKSEVFCLKRLFKQSEFIHNMEELPHAVFNLAKQIIL